MKPNLLLENLRTHFCLAEFAFVNLEIRNFISRRASVFRLKPNDVTTAEASNESRVIN